jgi:hypothetical protein
LVPFDGPAKSQKLHHCEFYANDEQREKTKNNGIISMLSGFHAEPAARVPRTVLWRRKKPCFSRQAPFNGCFFGTPFLTGMV